MTDVRTLYKMARRTYREALVATNHDYAAATRIVEAVYSDSITGAVFASMHDEIADPLTYPLHVRKFNLQFSKKVRDTIAKMVEGLQPGPPIDPMREVAKVIATMDKFTWLPSQTVSIGNAKPYYRQFEKRGYRK